MDPAVNLAENSIKVYSENMGLPEPIKIVINQKCPKSLKIYGKKINVYDCFSKVVIFIVQKT